jgi:NADP oxidoreductase coenzyme F420-dependent
MTEPLKIGVLGPVRPDGLTIALGFLGQGQPVMIGSRDPGKLDAWLRDAGPHARVGTFAEIAQFGDLIVLSASKSSSSPAICSMANGVSAFERGACAGDERSDSPDGEADAIERHAAIGRSSPPAQPRNLQPRPRYRWCCPFVAGVETAGRSQCQDNHTDRGM